MSKKETPADASDSRTKFWSKEGYKPTEESKPVKMAKEDREIGMQPKFAGENGFETHWKCPYCDSELAKNSKDILLCTCGYQYDEVNVKELWTGRWGGREPPAEITPLSHLAEIENPAYTAKRITLDAIVSGTAYTFLSPAVVENWGIKTSIESLDPLNLELIGITSNTQFQRLCSFLGLGGDDDVSGVKVNGYRTIYHVRARPPVFTLEQRGAKIVD